MKQLIEFLFPMRTHLLTQLIIQRADAADRLREKDHRIAQLELALSQSEGECARMRTVLMPLSSAAGASFVRAGQPSAAPPKFEPIATGWQNELKKFMEETDKAEALAKEKANV
jgi:hypothetical protein